MRAMFLDTSYAIALTVRNDAHHSQATFWAEWLEKNIPKLHLHDGILLEIGDGFAGRGLMPIGIELVSELIADPQTVRHPLTSELVDQALDFQTAHGDKTWGLTDCVSFVVMREHGLTGALTADRHFTQAGFRALLHESPPK